MHLYCLQIAKFGYIARTGSFQGPNIENIKDSNFELENVFFLRNDLA